MRFNFTHQHRTSGTDRLTVRNKIARKLTRAILCLGIFCFTSGIANAQTMWTESRTGVASAASRFKVNFNITNGTLHIETFAHHPDYWMQALSHYMAYIRSAAILFTTDGVNWSPFYSFGFIQNTIAFSNPIWLG